MAAAGVAGYQTSALRPGSISIVVTPAANGPASVYFATVASGARSGFTPPLNGVGSGGGGSIGVHPTMPTVASVASTAAPFHARPALP